MAFDQASYSYKIENGKLFWKEQEVKGADLSTLEIFNANWAADAKRVYGRNFVMRSIDRDSLVVLNAIFVKDKDSVYELDGKLSVADAETFEALDAGTVLKSDYPLQQGYARDRNKVYFGDGVGRAMIVRGADPSTFRPLTHNYYRDDKHIFSGTSPLPKCDPESFQIIENEYGHFARDAKHVYYGSKLIEGADVKSFRINSEGIKVDDESVFFGWEKAALDPNSVRTISKGLFADHKSVYYFANLIEGADPETFVRISDSYFKDKAYVYYKGSGPPKPIPGADASTFEIFIGICSWCRDAQRVYYWGDPMPSVDRETFSHLGDRYYKDKSHVYYCKVLLPDADVKTFQYLRDGDARDAKMFYRDGKEVPLSEMPEEYKDIPPPTSSNGASGIGGLFRKILGG